MKNRWNTLLVCAIAIVLIAVGVAKGQHLDVFYKAATICLECIGIG